MKYGDLRYAPREMARGVDLQFAGGGGVEGLLKDTDKYTHVHVRYLLLPLSHCPTPHVLYAYFLPLTL